MEHTFLIIEDDAQIRGFIRFALKSQNYSTIEVSDAQTALHQYNENSISVIILDLGLPDMDGIDLIKELRKISVVPIIVVSARDQDYEKVEALDAGADDYLTKPFSIEELLARIRVVFRHINLTDSDSLTACRVGGLEINLNQHNVTKNGTELHMTPIEYNILKLLARNAGKVMTHKLIISEVWGSYLECDIQTLRVFMANIRRKIEDNPTNPRYILTEVGIGYRLASE